MVYERPTKRQHPNGLKSYTVGPRASREWVEQYGQRIKGNKHTKAGGALATVNNDGSVIVRRTVWAKTKREARILEADMQKRLDALLPLDKKPQPKPSVGATTKTGEPSVLDLLMAYITKEGQGNTDRLEHHLKHLEAHLEGVRGPWHKLTKEAVLTYAALREYKHNASRWTVRRETNFVGAAFNRFADGRKEAIKNPAARLGLAIPAPRAIMLTTEEEHRLVAALNDPRCKIRDHFMVAMLTGMRQGQILNLTAGDCDLTAKMMLLPKSKEHRKHKKERKKEAMHSHVYEILRRRCEGRRSGERLFKVGNCGNMRVEQRTLANAWQRVVKRAGVEKIGGFRWHDLRKIFTDRMQGLGATPAALKGTGLYEAQTALAHYTRPNPEHARPFIEALPVPGGTSEGLCEGIGKPHRILPDATNGNTMQKAAEAKHTDPTDGLDSTR